MDPAKGATVNSALPEVPHKNMTSLLFSKETTSYTEPDAKEPMKREVEDASIGDLASNKDAAAHTHVNGHSSEAPTLDKGPIDDSMKADVVKGDPDNKSNLSLIPLTNGHLEEPANAPNENGHFDDIWSPATKLKRRLEDTKDLIVCPGVYDGFSARIALSVGFDAMYMVIIHFLL